MNEKEFVCGLALSFNDMCAISAACGAMSVQMMHEADCEKDIVEALHLAKIHLRIDKALRKVMEEEKIKEQSEGVGN